MLRAHDRTFGGPSLRELVELVGLSPEPVGAIDRATAAELEAALTRTGLAVFVVEAGAGGEDLPDLAAFVWACRRADRPLLVIDPGGAATEPALDLGAELIALDGTALGLCAAGLLLGGGPALDAAERALGGSGGVFRADPLVLEAIAARAAAALAGWSGPGSLEPQGLK